NLIGWSDEAKYVAEPYEVKISHDNEVILAANFHGQGVVNGIYRFKPSGSRTINLNAEDYTDATRWQKLASTNNGDKKFYTGRGKVDLTTGDRVRLSYG